jgi:hypothetical protein
MTPPRRFAVPLLVGAVFVLTSSLRAQPADELIDKLLELSRAKTKLKADKGDDPLRRLLVERYNVAVDELKLRCEDFKKHTATKAMVVEAGKQLLHADLELQDKPADKAKVLERAVELLRWYENRLERAAGDGLVPRADLLRVRYNRLGLEIDLARLKKEMAAGGGK